MSRPVPLATILIALFAASAALLLFPGRGNNHPVPTGGPVSDFQSEDNGSREKREAWLDLMHSSGTGMDWKQIEQNNDYQRHLRRTSTSAVISRGGTEVLANGHVTGQWKELGSTNQAGSVINTLYDAQTDEIFVVSAGGSLFKGKRDGSAWSVVNQDLRMNEGLLEWLPMGFGRRMVAMIGRIPHYSDDDGLTWVPATGISYTDRWGGFHSPVVVRDSGLVYVLSKKDYWSNVRLYRSADAGESYEWIGTMTNSNFDNFRLFSPHGSTEVYLLQRSGTDTRLYRINHALSELELLSKNESFLLGNARANLAGNVADTATRLFVYNQIDGEAPGWFETTDFGEHWQKVGELPAPPWGVGVYVCPSNPEVLLLGEVECYRSEDSGASWTKVNQWWEYYDAPATMLHADMMHFSEFQTIDGQPFLLVSNHGGLSISYDEGVNHQNIGMEGLNVSQYYSLKSSSAAPYLFFGGSQDQGFQRGVSLGEGPYQMNQLISGDYGHITFSKGGARLWTVYPGGWVIVYRNLTDNGHAASWEMVSANESVWIPPLHETGVPQEDAVYMAGGHVDGSEGSHLVKLVFQNSTSQVTASQFPFDFRDASGGELSAIEVSPIDPLKLYAATTNGRFFWSVDGGETWEQAVNFLPSGHYLYGQTILASAQVPDRVILGGSGYDSPGVWISEDGGETFLPLGEGLPSTLVFELCTDPEEQWIFAATEAGPWVYVWEDQQWYDLAGATAPAQTYWSVQYLKGQNGGKDKVRFGTYGRGGWDLELEDIVLYSDGGGAVKDSEWQLFPNPAMNEVFIQHFDNRQKKAQTFTVYNQQGKTLQRGVFLDADNQQRVDLSQLTTGLYYLEVGDERGTTLAVMPLVKQ